MSFFRFISEGVNIIITAAIITIDINVKNMSITRFKVNNVAVEDFDASSDFVTDLIRLDGVSTKWSVKFENNTTGGGPTYTIQYSMDGVNFHSLEGAINLPIDKGILKSFQAVHSTRISYTANGATGTVTLNYGQSYEAVR